jgi:hypothetical protein
LMLVPFAPTLAIAIALLLIRSTLSQMDVPARTSYVMAVVTPPERPAAASITAAPRSLAGAASPVLAGYLLGLSSFGWPLVIGGGLNSLYDLLLLFMFRKVRPPEEQVSADVKGDVASSYHVADPSVPRLVVSALRAVPRPLTSWPRYWEKAMAADKSHAKDWRGFRPVHSAHSSHRGVARNARAYLLPSKPLPSLRNAPFRKTPMSVTRSRLIYPRRSRGVRSSRTFGPWYGFQSVRTDMLRLHIGFRTVPRLVRTEPGQQDRESSTPDASCSRLDRILFTSGDRAPSASVA